jgi:hypothetical protein
MIESIGGIGAVTAFTPSAGRSTERRQRRLKWLSSLRAALDEDGLPIDETDEDGPDAPCARAQIADALGAVEEMRAGLGHGRDDVDADGSGPTITATELAKRIAASAARSLAVQAHIGAAAARRYVDGRDENAQ